MAYFKKHVFFCLNQRENGQESCVASNAAPAFEHCKKLIKEAGLAKPGGIRINKAGCLDRCSNGPVAVVYPEGIWYGYFDLQDIDAIVQSHLIDNTPLQKLIIE